MHPKTVDSDRRKGGWTYEIKGGVSSLSSSTSLEYDLNNLQLKCFNLLLIQFKIINCAIKTITKFLKFKSSK